MRRRLHRLLSADLAALCYFWRWRWQYRLAFAGLTGLALPLLFHIWYIAFGGNFHTVVPGTLYRSAQPSEATLRSLVSSHGIRTVINLRGDNIDPWYFEEHETGQSLGVCAVDVGLWARQPPPADQFRILIETLADAPGAILVHCKSGGDRSGLAAALGILLRSDATLLEARRQLSLYYGHNPFGKASCHERVLDRYEEWLSSNGISHNAANLRSWAQSVYSPIKCWEGG